jgi:hypothetical protein
VRVRNIIGTSGRRCQCGSWLNHHYIETGSSQRICSIFGCGNEVSVGGHVEVVSSSDQGHYIVPLCHTCNARLDDMELKRNVVAVSANTRFMGCTR